MDTLRTGQFLKELRKEKGFTQEQLGEKLGVSNKTVSRWENGNYMPPVECLEMLSDLYGISMNEIVSGKKLEPEEFADAAEDNLKNALVLSEQAYKKTEKGLSVTMIISTILAILIIILLPTQGQSMVRSIILVIMVAALVFIGNTVNLVALAMNKERYDTASK